MYLKDKQTGDLVEVLTLDDLFDPFKATVSGRFHAGEELQEPRNFAKADLIFPSGEGLPRCWTDPHYKD
ncbi:MAG TPA: acetyltransferase [Gammaproteobacteria bacterium]|nr:acetyltransferase [Gammaproteobacteria bacterium]